MKTRLLPNHVRDPVSRKSYRIPYVRTFALLALIVIILMLAALGRSAPANINLNHGAELASVANGLSSTDSPAPARAP